MGDGARGRGWNSGTIGGLLVAVAVVGGLGIASGRAAPALPTAFELTHQRILSVIGTYSADVSLAKRVQKIDGDGDAYFVDVGVGKATLEMTVTDQRGTRFKINSMKIAPVAAYTPDPYDDGYGEDPPPDPAPSADGDEQRKRRPVTGRLKYRRKRVGTGQYARVDEFVDWTSSATLRRKTRVNLKGVTQLGYGTEDAPYGEFNFDGSKSNVAGGVTPKLASGKGSALIRGFRLARGNGVLHGDITWNGARSGTVRFTAPSNLAGKKGTIRKVGKDYQVTGPRGYTTRIVFRNDGSGTVNLGLGAFKVATADYGGFQLTFE